MAKRMSKTLATEIAERTMTVVNPLNRLMALNATLQRHGFATTNTAQPGHLVDRGNLIAWLLATYASPD